MVSYGVIVTQFTAFVHFLPGGFRDFFVLFEKQVQLSDKMDKVGRASSLAKAYLVHFIGGRNAHRTTDVSAASAADMRSMAGLWSDSRTYSANPQVYNHYLRSILTVISFPFTLTFA